MLWPQTYASPCVGLRSVARIFIVVVFPAPLGPIKPNKSPAARSSSIDWMAYISPYFLVRSTVLITAWRQLKLRRISERWESRGDRRSSFERVPGRDFHRRP